MLFSQVTKFLFEFLNFILIRAQIDRRALYFPFFLIRFYQDLLQFVTILAVTSRGPHKFSPITATGPHPHDGPTFQTVRSTDKIRRPTTLTQRSFRPMHKHPRSTKGPTIGHHRSLLRPLVYKTHLLALLQTQLTSY